MRQAAANKPGNSDWENRQGSKAITFVLLVNLFSVDLIKGIITACIIYNQVSKYIVKGQYFINQVVTVKMMDVEDVIVSSVLTDHLQW